MTNPLQLIFLASLCCALGACGDDTASSDGSLPDGSLPPDGSARDGSAGDGSIGDGFVVPDAANSDGSPMVCTDGTMTSQGRSKGESCSDLCGRETQAPEVVRCETELTNNRLDGSTHVVRIQPWQVANDDGSEPSYPRCDLLEDIADKVYAQANVDVVFLPWRAWNSTAGRVDVAANSCLDWVVDDAPQHDDPNVLNLYMIKELNPGRVGGIGTEPGTTFFVCEDCFDSSAHVLAHEMGHNLGLGHSNLGAGEDDRNLMSAALPSNDIGDVFPDGEAYLHLTPQQIETILANPAVSPIE